MGHWLTSAVVTIVTIIAWSQTLFVCFSAPIFHPIPGEFCWTWPPDLVKVMKNAPDWSQGTLLPASN